MVEGLIVYNRDDYLKNREFADRFILGGSLHGLHIRLEFHDEMNLTKGVLPTEPVPAFVINRTRDWRLSLELERRGCRAFNSSEVTRIGNDKAEAHSLATQLGLPQVDMAVCRNAPDKIALHGLGYPVILKNPYGHGGKEVFIVRDEDSLRTIAAGMPCDRVLLQRPCGRPGEDVRVYVFGGRILTAVKRRSASDFRANLSLGGSVGFYELSPGERELAERIIDALWLDYAGIDFILDANGGFLFNELEDAVGARSLYQLGFGDVADMYMKYIAETMN